MAHESEADSLLGRVADERLLASEDSLPAALGRPAAIVPSSSSRRWIVGVGATLTGLTLLLGTALLILGVVGLIANGFGGLTAAALVAGVALLATHWGWVHVAEWTASGVEGRRERVALEGRERWLLAIEPYTRYEVSTRVGEDGAITIARTRHEPVPTGEGRFTFVATVEHSEVHSAEEPGAVVTERAEALRSQAARDTEAARQEFERAAGSVEAERLRSESEQSVREALRAESEALSERINANLRDPPLGE